jgi:3-methylcrotonyl-CoA carboxylase alpha subunit
VIGSILIANRGEIACRIVRTARRLGIRTVAVYSDADAKALHVRQADEAVHIGPSPARESYLVGEKIIAAAKATGAEAIHPGYGFLSENAAFAQAVIDAGLLWIGPNPASITAMGLKDAAKKLMAEAGVPVTPGYLGEDQSPERLRAEADAIGYPVLIKAVAGGGGKGMRRVDAAEEFADALLSCKREAASSFGDDRVLIEKYIQRPRHIEVQVFGDSHGNVVHLFERDCSLQRRHQKVIEEAPAPGMDEATRAAVCGAAVKAAQAVDYVGAGTIEFIADASEGLRADRIWFMEMNTRLQVEHPVTEEITGQDLVEWQLRVASGESLPKRQEELSIAGHAIEVRLYAEDASKDFLPAIGDVEIFDLARDGVRLEMAVEAGDRITPFYDPMIGKLIVHADDRDEAIETLAGACADAWIWPLKTNAPFLWRALDHPDFRSGDVDTSFIPSRLETLIPPIQPTEDMLKQGAVALLTLEADPNAAMLWGQAYEGSLEGIPGAVWREATGFRLNRTASRTVAVNADGSTHMVELPEGWERVPIDAERRSGGAVVFHDGDALFVSPSKAGGGGAGASAGDGAIISPMPGKIIALDVAAGDAVAKGQKLLTLEAMKMEHSLAAPFDGVVAELNAEAGAQVSEGALLARIAKGE